MVDLSLSPIGESVLATEFCQAAVQWVKSVRAMDHINEGGMCAVLVVVAVI